jgi:hypothetical protein
MADNTFQNIAIIGEKYVQVRTITIGQASIELYGLEAILNNFDQPDGNFWKAVSGRTGIIKALIEIDVMKEAAGGFILKGSRYNEFRTWLKEVVHGSDNSIKQAAG